MKVWPIFLVVALVTFACGGHKTPSSVEKNDATEESVIEIPRPTISDTTLFYQSGEFEVSVRVKMPENQFRGTILVLQGWNFPNTSWSDSTYLEEYASEDGFALVMPDMGKSIYHKHIYEQTRKDWRKYPTRTWLVDTLLHDLDAEYGLFSKDGNNFVMGLSTGGRGAFIIAQENPGIFAAGASLSGDYDQAAFPDDNLYRGYFGSIPALWSASENPVSFADEWSVPMYFAHGKEDKIVSVAHQNRLQSIAEKHGLDKDWYFYVSEGYGHNYAFWSKEIVPIMDYFLQFTLR